MTNITIPFGNAVVIRNGGATVDHVYDLEPGVGVTVVAGAKPIDPPPPVPSGNNILGVDFAKRPQSGGAWDAMVSASKSAGAVSLTATDGHGEGNLLALAFWAAATNSPTGKAKVVSICRAALNGAHSRTLEQARNLAPIAIALDVIGDHSLDADLKRERDYKASDQGSVIDCHGKRPNNWGTCAGLARIAVSAHLKDTADLAKAVTIHKGWLGDRSAYAGFAYGDMSWQFDSSRPVGINPKGAVKSGTNIDGVLPDDQRRASAFPSYTNENYVWQALGEVAATQFILRASGYPDVFSWSDDAVKRAYANRAAHHFGVTGDDGWQVAAAKVRGVTISGSGGPGKSFGWADFLYA